MNQRQLRTLWVGIVIAIAMFPYPPWHLALADGWSRDYGYAFLVAGPQTAAGQPVAVVRVNYPRLAAQWFLVALVTAGAITTLKDNE